jgi:mRNA-degrading endonuclease RelE of RelBE toxin-antitoxin system
MPVRIVATSTYEQAVRKLLSVDQRQAMEAAICADPLGAPIISGSGGVRKVRWAASGKGKRGGMRVIYFFYPARLSSICSPPTPKPSERA